MSKPIVQPAKTRSIRALIPYFLQQALGLIDNRRPDLQTEVVNRKHYINNSCVRLNKILVKHRRARIKLGWGTEYIGSFYLKCKYCKYCKYHKYCRARITFELDLNPVQFLNKIEIFQQFITSSFHDNDHVKTTTVTEVLILTQ